MNEKKIVFYPSSSDVYDSVPPPKSARLYSPEWYKSVKFFNGGAPEFNNGVITNITVKSCSPFSDAMNLGYIQETWTDIYIEEKNGDVTYHWKNGNIPIIGHRVFRSGVKIPEGYYDIEFLWFQPWTPILPKGYSVLYTNPINNLSLYTISTSGVVDHDSFKYITEGRYPFFLKKGFTGIIPAGTPMYQIVPFKRDNWKSEITEFNKRVTDAARNTLLEKFWGKYKSSYRKEKKFL